MKSFFQESIPLQFLVKIRMELRQSFYQRALADAGRTAQHY